MIPQKLSLIAKKVSGKLTGEDKLISTLSHDTRTMKPGDLFIAIQGDNFNGHDYIHDAIKQGALALIVETSVDTDIPVLQVANTRKALGLIAEMNRDCIDIPVIALTGSCGKTTCKTMISTILETQGIVHATKGTLNNDLGVPFTLLALNKTHQYSVVELGANHVGEIDYLSALVKPQVAMITNINPVHVEGFGSIEAIAKEKGTIFTHLAKEGIAVFPYASPYELIWLKNLKHKQRYLTFGMDEKADVYAKDISMDSNMHYQFTLCYQGQAVEINLPTLGEHNVNNALAAASCCIAAGISLQTIQSGLKHVQAVNGRLNLHHLSSGGLVIDDSYNANPVAAKKAIDVLMNTAYDKHIFVLGEMGELGSESSKYHAEVGVYAKEKGVDHLLTFGNMTQHAVNAFGNNSENYTDKKQLLRHLGEQIGSNTAVLIKGSRSTHLEELVHALISEENKEYSC